MLVDTHCHVAADWYVPVEDLLFQMDRAGVERAVLVQMRGEYNNDYQTRCLKQYPGRFASVVGVDVSDTDASGRLQELAAQGATGIRLDCADRSPGDDPLAIWRMVAELDLTVSGRGVKDESGARTMGAIARELPHLRIVVEHLGGWNNPRSGAEGEADRRAMVELARLPNVAIKIHGLGEFAERAMPPTHPFPFVRPLPPALDKAYAAFGASRMMWGSDFPPVSSREGYMNALNFTRGELESKTSEELERIFGGSALDWFRFS